MSEAPEPVQASSAAAPAAKPHRSWVELVIAVAAIFISAVSLFVALDQSRTERKLLAASSWPFLTYATSREGIAPAPQTVFLRIENGGVGPARLKTLVVRYAGRVVRGHDELMGACCGLPAGLDQPHELALGVVNLNAPQAVYAAHDGVTFLAWKRTPAAAAVWDRLNDARHGLTFQACYCSVLEECWTSDLKTESDPHPIQQCPAPEADQYRG